MEFIELEELVDMETEKSAFPEIRGENGLPEGWRVVKVYEIGKIETGSTPSKQNSSYYSNDFPFFKPTDLEAGYNVYKASDNLSKVGIKQGRFLPENSILVTCIGATIGKTGIIRKAGVSNQQINAIIPSENYDPNFVYFQAIAPKFQEQIKNNAAATTLPILNKTKFQNLEMVVCSLVEQQKIVSKIEELFSELDKGKQQLETAREQLKIYRQSVLKWAFEGKLTNADVTAKGFEPLGENLVRRGTEPHNLPDGWKWVKIEDVALTYGGYAFKSGEFKEQGKFQVLRMGNVRPGIIRYNESPVFFENVEENVLSRALLLENDVIITQTGTKNKRDYGFTALITKPNLLLNQRIAAIRFLENYLPKFFLYFSWTDTFKDQFFCK